jgi:transposase
MQCSFRGLRAVEKETVVMGRPRKYSDELRRRAIDEVLERDRKVPEVAKQLGIASPESLRRWVRQAEIDRGLKTGPTTEELAEIKALRKEVADQQRTIEILKAATTYFAQEADPRPR